MKISIKQKNACSTFYPEHGEVERECRLSFTIACRRDAHDARAIFDVFARTQENAAEAIFIIVKQEWWLGAALRIKFAAVDERDDAEHRQTRIGFDALRCANGPHYLLAPRSERQT